MSPPSPSVEVQAVRLGGWGHLQIPPPPPPSPLVSIILSPSLMIGQMSALMTLLSPIDLACLLLTCQALWTAHPSPQLTLSTVEHKDFVLWWFKSLDVTTPNPTCLNISRQPLSLHSPDAMTEENTHHLASPRMQTKCRVVTNLSVGHAVRESPNVLKWIQRFPNLRRLWMNTWCGDQDTNIDLSRILTAIPASVREFMLQCQDAQHVSYICNGTFPSMVHFERLTSLQLSDMQCDDSAWALWANCIHHCKQLTEVKLDELSGWTAVSTASEAPFWAALRECTSLRRLYLLSELNGQVYIRFRELCGHHGSRLKGISLAGLNPLSMAEWALWIKVFAMPGMELDHVFWGAHLPWERSALRSSERQTKSDEEALWRTLMVTFASLPQLTNLHLDLMKMGWANVRFLTTVGPLYRSQSLRRLHIELVGTGHRIFHDGEVNALKAEWRSSSSNLVCQDWGLIRGLAPEFYDIWSSSFANLDPILRELHLPRDMYSFGALPRLRSLRILTFTVSCDAREQKLLDALVVALPLLVHMQTLRIWRDHTKPSWCALGAGHVYEPLFQAVGHHPSLTTFAFWPPIQWEKDHEACCAMIRHTKTLSTLTVEIPLFVMHDLVHIQKLADALIACPSLRLFAMTGERSWQLNTPPGTFSTTFLAIEQSVRRTRLWTELHLGWRGVGVGKTPTPPNYSDWVD